jgi:hypothetical protein
MTLDEIANELSRLADAAEDAGARDIAHRINCTIDVIEMQIEGDS